MPASAPTWTSRSQPEEIVAYSTALARRLLDHERFGSGQRPAVGSLELARTQPVEGSGGAYPAVTDDLRRRKG
jgi:hypothetical protein